MGASRTVTSVVACFGARWNALFEGAEVFEVVVEAGAVAGAESTFQIGDILFDGVENALVVLHPRKALGGGTGRLNMRSKTTRGLISIGRGSVSAPGERVHIRAGVGGVAATDCSR